MSEKITISEKQYHIIKAAGKILSVYGVSGLTTKNLAKEMNFSESAIYRHFASKEEIIIAMLNYLVENLDDKYSSNISQNLSAKQKFEQLFQLQFDFFNDNPHFVLAVFSDGLLEESEKINEAILRIMELKRKHLLPIIEEGQYSDEFSSIISAEDALHVSMGTIRLLMFKWRLANFEFDLKEKGNHIVQVLLKILK